MEVAMVEAVLKSSMGRMRRRSRMCMKQERERLEMWLEKERRGSKVTPRLRTGASEVKEVEDELSERCIEGSGIFLIWAGRAIMMNSVLEGLRRRRLDDISKRNRNVYSRPTHARRCSCGQCMQPVTWARCTLTFLNRTIKTTCDPQVAYLWIAS